MLKLHLAKPASPPSPAFTSAVVPLPDPSQGSVLVRYRERAKGRDSLYSEPSLDGNDGSEHPSNDGGSDQGGYDDDVDDEALARGAVPLFVEFGEGWAGGFREGTGFGEPESYDAGFRFPTREKDRLRMLGGPGTRKDSGGSGSNGVTGDAETERMSYDDATVAMSVMSMDDGGSDVGGGGLERLGSSGGV
ncbi:hypothetical protein HK101_006636, partial [Irineochytrium annulatum]